MKNKKRIATSIRWIARIWGSLVLAFGLLTFGGELVAEISGEKMFWIESASDLITLLLFPASAIIGLGIALKWEGLGGLITIGAIIGFQLIDGRLSLDIITWLFAVPGLLYLIYWYLTRGRKENLET